MNQKNLGLIGIGNMGSVFLTSLLRDNVNHYKKFCIFDMNTAKTEPYDGNDKILICSNTREVVEIADTIILIVKPQSMEDVLNHQKIKEKLVLIAIYGFLSFVGFILTTIFFTNDPESNLFLLFVDFGVIFILGLIFWVFGLKSLRNHHFEILIRNEEAEKEDLNASMEKIKIDKQF